MEKLASAIHPLLDAPPVDIPGVIEGSLRKRMAALKSLKPLVKSGTNLEFSFSKTESTLYKGCTVLAKNLLKYLITAMWSMNVE